jgi:hypothetical protein
MKYDENGRGIVREDVYGFWVDQGRGVVVSYFHRHPKLTVQDLWYWT